MQHHFFCLFLLDCYAWEAGLADSNAELRSRSFPCTPSFVAVPQRSFSIPKMLFRGLVDPCYENVGRCRLQVLPLDCRAALCFLTTGCCFAGVFVGSGIFKSDNAAQRAKAIVQATTHYNDAKVRRDWSTCLRAQCYVYKVLSLFYMRNVSILSVVHGAATR